ncbi:hypothetical protein DFH09DRAFT_1178130 [Mycena vulgaris]|nr:hypothetical protein DFH09DRAFT_1178130 [Mycena vulgaris]
MLFPSLLSRFPQELIELLIDECRQSTRTLRSCALVCRAFRPRSQAHIFAHVECVLFYSTESLQRLYDVLSDSPHLAQHIRSLRIADDTGPAPETVLSRLDKTLVPVLQLISDLREFEMTSVTWSRLPPRSKAAICELCARSGLTSLEMIDVGELTVAEFSQLVASPALTEMFLGQITLTDPPDGACITNREVQLKDLTLSSDSVETLASLYKWLARGSCLRSLCVGWSLETTAHLRSLMSASKATLKRLAFDTGAGLILYNSPSFSLAGMSSLRVIAITVAFNLSGPADSFAPWVTECLHSHGSPSTLTKITLIIDLLMTGNQPAAAGSADWDTLARLLTEERFPLLRQFRLEFFPDGMGDPDLDGSVKESFVAAARQGLPGLDARGLFFV